MIGVLDKVGTFGMIRLCLPIFPNLRLLRPIIIVLAVIGIIYGALLARGQTDITRLIAYTSISHFGFIVLGIFAFTTQSQSGSTLYMVNHGFTTAGMFILAGYLISRRGSKYIADYGGVSQVAPILARHLPGRRTVLTGAPGRLPASSGEFLVLVGSFTRHPYAAVIATLGIIPGAIYILWLYQRMMTGPVKSGCEGMKGPQRPRIHRHRAGHRHPARVGLLPDDTVERDQPGR